MSNKTLSTYLLSNNLSVHINFSRFSRFISNGSVILVHDQTFLPGTVIHQRI